MLPAVLLTVVGTLTNTALAQNTYAVPGNSGHNWVNTKLDLPPGTLVRLEATGQVDVGSGWGSYGPEGTTRFGEVGGYPSETRHRYGLVARLTASRTIAGDDIREDWAFGDTREHCAARGGHLWLTVNDDAPANNSGEFRVTVMSAGPCREISTPRPAVVSVEAYRDNRRDRPARVGSTVVIYVRNDTSNTIYFRRSVSGDVLMGREGLRVERFDGARWLSVIPALRPDDIVPTIQELPGRGGTHRREWVASSATGLGTYRVAFLYFADRELNAPMTIYSEPFDVVR